MKFNEKLEKRMKQKNMVTKEFAEMLYNYGSDSDLCNSPDNKSSLKSHVRKVQKWIAGDAEPANIEELKKICDILDCDFDYLLGDALIANLSNKKVGEWLGLDEVTISNIKDYDEIYKIFLSCLVRSKNGDILLEFLRTMFLHSGNSSNKKITIEDTITGEVEELKGDDAIDFTVHRIQKYIESILMKVSIIGMEIGKIKRENKKIEDERKHKEEIEKLMNECIVISGKSREEIEKEIGNK